MTQLSEADLVYLEIDSKYSSESPLAREAIIQLIEEVRQWRSLGASPESVEREIESLRWDVEMANELQDELEEALADIDDLQAKLRSHAAGAA